MLSILPAFSSPDLKEFLLLKKSFKSSAGGQRRDCVIYSVPLSLHSINPTDSPRHASRLWRSLFLVKVCARAGKTIISRPNVCASGSCRALRACLLAVPVAFSEGLRPPQNRPPPPRSRVLTDASASVLTSPSCPARRVGGCLIYVM